jgi:hypothetical protein
LLEFRLSTNIQSPEAVDEVNGQREQKDGIRLVDEGDPDVY